MGFFETLLATIAGAMFASGTTALIFVADGRRAYRARLDDAVAGIMLAIPARVHELDDFHRRLEKQRRNSKTSLTLPPGPYDLGVRLEAARLLARGDDAKTLAAVADAFYALTDLPPAPQRARLSQLAEQLRKWRHGELGQSPWAVFSRIGLSAEMRKGLTPPAPWDISRRIVTDAASRADADADRKHRWWRLRRR